jgi:2,5-dihydroxypyridine 5,6-dioxygenase
VAPGDNVLIVWDDVSASRDMAEALRAAVLACDAKPYVLTYEPDGHFERKDFCHFAAASLRRNELRLPPIMKGALLGADCVILLISDLRVPFAPEFGEIISSGKRAIRITQFDSESSLRMLPSSAEEVQRLADAVRRAGDRFARAREARVTSQAGTDLTLSLGQYKVGMHLGSADGTTGLQILPGGQVARTPDDRSARGVLVIDRAIQANDYRDLTEPIRLIVEAGSVQRIEGELEAEKLRRFLKDLNDPNVYHLTELSLGVNRRCRFSGVAGGIEESHTAGAVAMAVGCDTHQGGSTPAPVHIDMTMRWATLELDGQRVVEEGKLLLEH